jgi:hypothetical protein
MNRRKAMIGWLVYSLAKPIAKQAIKRKAKEAAPAQKPKSRLAVGAAAIVGTLAALGGALFFWRKKSDGGKPSTES